MDAFSNFDQALAELESVIGREAFCLETAIGHIALMNVIDRRKEQHRKTSHVYRYMKKNKKNVRGLRRARDRLPRDRPVALAHPSSVTLAAREARRPAVGAGELDR